MIRRSAAEKESAAVSGGPMSEALMKRMGYLLSRTAAHVRRRTADAFQPFGIIPPQHAVLAALVFHGPQTQKALGQHLKIDPTTMVWLIDELEKKKLVRRENHPADRRSYLVTVTAAGKALFDRSDKRLDLLEEELLSALSKSERAHLRKLLTKLYLSVSARNMRLRHAQNGRN